MKIFIFNGNPDSGPTGIDAYLDELSRQLESGGHSVEIVVLRDRNIHQCIGCWDCWIKTPGECVFKDDMKEICRSLIHSDLTLFASPLKMGFVTALLKRSMDRLIPIIHPYIILVEGESHHLERYEHYPRIGLLCKPEEGGDREDIEITEAIFRRLAINMKSDLALSFDTNSSIKEVANAVNAL